MHEAKVGVATYPFGNGDLPRRPSAEYYVFEDEVPRAGVRVSQCYERTRGPDGSVLVWYGARKQTGRGEGSSGLGFDRIVNAPTD